MRGRSEGLSRRMSILFLGFDGDTAAGGSSGGDFRRYRMRASVMDRVVLRLWVVA